MQPPDLLSKLWPLVDVVFRRLFDKPHLLCGLLQVPEIEQADQELQMISQDRDLRVQYEMRLKAELDAASWQKDHIALWLEQGQKQGMELAQRAIVDLCDVLGIDVTEERRAWLGRLDLAQLEEVRRHLKQQRGWPPAV